ncbi:MAG TPA: glycoside hydrolase family 31 protein [Polyangiaceae bacterium LLY-WYZ-15_(1-7)]|nr:hypothetical protein [Sandaracinus sp.]HJL02970.1 glycoside hydrolase family 31 protein [Polyangiaceae bacterium LLY-WYZ-15_(1-7)]HJL13642.1 glycoside hydrolase family 31 protein [Polyangiaceae bacterium LLY-WYZ-15_(1-7)]HJL44393.1 glycoside hydrolase family 31 protein [Polyangiaceae bacterium LLY-WYZ-15_(1-7)]
MRSWLGVMLVGALALGACGDDDGTIDMDAGPDGGGADGGEADGGVDAGPEECTWEGGEAEALEDPPRHTPRWAFEPWISKDISDGEDTRSFVNGFLERDIPVGAVVIDSPWETQYNTFVPNPERYPDFEGMVDWLHERDIRIVLWVTQMVNVRSFDAEDGGDVYRGPSPNYREGLVCGFYVNEGRNYAWWKGGGAGVDFFHPEAVAWWRRQQDTVLDMGIDGWKLDFGESYIRIEPWSYDEIDAFDGTHTLQEYSEAYYRDFLQYGVHRRGSEFVTMVRAYDQSYDIPGRFYARPEHAPVVWLGDNERNWEGLVDVLDHAFRSAAEGYVMIGSDIGGYLDRDETNLTITIPFDQEVFARWVGLSGMMPYFQLHGRANLEPWNIPERTEETVELYRYWAQLHSDMVPFWYSLAEEAYGGGDNILQPIGEDLEAWEGDWRYRVGDAFLVAPPLEAGGVRDVALPEGSAWFDWWSGERHAGGTTLEAYAGATDRRRIPIFVREGAIVPMRVRSAVTGFGDASAADWLTVAVWEGASESAFVMHDEDEATTTITSEGETLSFSRVATQTIVRWTYAPPAEQDVIGVDVGGSEATEAADRAAFDAATEASWLWDAASGLVWVKVPESAGEVAVEIQTGVLPG